jgi:topoisomerase-4 subunit A
MSDNETLDLFAEASAAEAEQSVAKPDTAAPAVPADAPETTPPVAPSTGQDAAPPAEPPLPEPEQLPEDEYHNLREYTHNIYMRYALSVVKDRAIPSVSDGQKPVQRRILYAMHRLGLVSNAKPIKSARVVGDVIGKYHPHGDSASYEAMVRMAQDFVLRYPLVDGQGNFGSLDGDTPAAMRYTEARLTRYAELLLSEVDAGTVDFVPNYDGSEEEPADLPSRMPFLLLNGASGIAVGMATECLPHNMREMAAAAVALMKCEDPTSFTTDDLMQHVQGPDFPGGGQIISSQAEIRAAYETGRGSLRVRARWDIEKQARGQWRMVVNELPYGVSVRKVLEELGEITDPQPKAGKKDLSAEQKALKQVFLDAIEVLRDESGKDAAVRIVIEPRSSRMDQDQFIALLLTHTSLETTAPINLVALGLNGKPAQKSVVQILSEWVDFRYVTVRRRTETRLDKVQKRIHILEGRMAVLLNIDEVIRIIRESDEPKPALMTAFKLTEIQAEDILEIRLRQLARLEAIKVESELNDLRIEEGELQNILANRAVMRDLIINEIETDATKYGDARRTLIEAAERVSLDKAATIPDEPCTIILSKNGWVRQRQGYDVDLGTINFKDGDSLLALVKTRTTYPISVLDSTGRAYSLPISSIPGGRSDGAPVTSMVELTPKAKVVVLLSGKEEQKYLFANSGGYGYIAAVKDTVTRQRAGKSFMTVQEGEQLLPPVPMPADAAFVAALSSDGRLLVFPIAELKELSAGRGVIVMGLADADQLTAVAPLKDGGNLVLSGIGRGGKAQEATVKWADLAAQVSRRARKGQKLPVKFKVESLRQAEE